MYDRRFLQSKLGHAAVASIGAMLVFIAITTQMQFDPAMAATPRAETTTEIELA